MLMNYHIGRLVLSSLCVGDFGEAGFRWCLLLEKMSTSSTQSYDTSDGLLAYKFSKIFFHIACRHLCCAKFTDYGKLWVYKRGSTVVKVLCYKSEGCWFDPSWRQWIFH